MSEPLTGVTCGRFIDELAGRTPTPGGGAAAAAAAAIGAAAGAMAAVYTTGKKWRDRAPEAQVLAENLQTAAQQALALADADAAAFAELKRTWSEELPEDERAAIQERARQVPLDILALCADASGRIQAFLPQVNPQIRSDALVALQLLAGAGGAAWHTLLVNAPDVETTARAQALLADCRAGAEVALGQG